MERNSLEVFIDELKELYRSERQFAMSAAEAAWTDDGHEFHGEFDRYPTQSTEPSHERD